MIATLDWVVCIGFNSKINLASLYCIKVGQLLEKGIIETAPLEYRRMLNDSFMILDKARSTTNFLTCGLL
ncbi:MAG: hypothetical protein AB8Y83_01435 [Coxiella endosymbiont of Haemaphysalis qinghaiensis]